MACPVPRPRGAPFRARPLALLFSGLLLLGSTGCISVGRHFPTGPIPQLHIGTTTQQQVLDSFGPPWRTGIDDGQRTWTYGYYHYSLFASPIARDLVIKFDQQGVVASYNYNTTRSSR